MKVWALLASGWAFSQAQNAPPGTVDAVYQLVERVLPGSSNLFDLQFATSCPTHLPCFSLSQNADKISVQGSTANEIASGVGHYFREVCNMTIGWPRGGGSNVFVPHEWPVIKAPIMQSRNSEWSYAMNVCTHSYSLVWYDWAEWEAFIDWAALSGLNLILAMTGQEEIQYKVFSQLGLSDLEIRSWFNGPAFLTWSRGQNEYGNDIAGPLPRSWMKAQWDLQRKILPRLRSLGIVGQLPGFQGNVPIQLKDVLGDSNITKQGDTGWMDSLDPQFGKIADLWMKILIEDFGTDHWYQLDGYFNGGTAPWYAESDASVPELPENWNASSVQPDPMSLKRGIAAYSGLNRTDPDAVWSFQGWAFISWNTAQQASFIKGFVDAVPKEKFVVIDMSVNGEGEWRKWNNASFFGANFIWTTLHDFGGTDGMKGNLAQINEIPFAGQTPQLPTSVSGTGFTPEGIDQNPVYYEFMLGANWREAPVSNLEAYAVDRAHRRYNIGATQPGVAKAWTLLVQGAYAQDLSVQDNTGVGHLPGNADYSQFAKDRHTPGPVICKTFKAWELLQQEAEAKPDLANLEPFRYDLINLGREIMAQITIPSSLNFSDATTASELVPSEVTSTGDSYVSLLQDLDKLVATDSAFLLGPWLRMAEHWGDNSTDCAATAVPSIDTCEAFYIWNAKVQLTTWNPTLKNDTSIPGGPIDYASKHWSGLISGYYAARATILQKQALKDASLKQPLDKSALSQLYASHAYDWTTSAEKYPTQPQGDVIEISRQVLSKYVHFFQDCGSN